jgi:hypothetical protein
MNKKILLLSLLCVFGCASKDPNFMKSDYKPKELENGKAVVIGSANYQTYKKGLANFGYGQQQSLFSIASSVVDLAKNKSITPQAVSNVAALTFERQSDGSDASPKKFTLGNLYGEGYEINHYGKNRYDAVTITPGIYKLVNISTFDYNGVNKLFGTREGNLNIVNFPPVKDSYFEVKAGEVLYIGDINIKNKNESGKSEDVGYRNIEVSTNDNTQAVERDIISESKFRLLRGKLQFKPLQSDKKVKS